MNNFDKNNYWVALTLAMSIGLGTVSNVFAENDPTTESQDEEKDYGFDEDNRKLMEYFWFANRSMSANGGQPSLLCSGGNCSFSTPDQVNQNIIAFLQNTNEVTRRRYEGLVARSNASLNELVRIVFEKDGLNDLATRSMATSEALKVTDIVQAYNKFQGGWQAARVNFDSYNSFFKGEITDIPLNDKKFIVSQFPALAKANTDIVEKMFTAGLIGLSRYVCNLKFTFELATGENQVDQHIFACKPGTGEVALDITPKGKRLTDEQIKAMQVEIARLETKTPDLIAAVKELNTLTVKRIKNLLTGLLGEVNPAANIISWKWAKPIIGGYGELSNDRANVTQDVFDDLVNIMWLRSAMRVAYGVGIGAIQINYTKDKEILKTNKDLFISRADIIGDLNEEPIYDQADASVLMDQLNLSYRRALTTSNSKASIIGILPGASPDLERGMGETKVTGKGAEPLKYTDLAIMEGSYSGPIDYMNSAYSLIRDGNIEKWRILNLGLKLMAADFYDEYQINRVDGLKKLYMFYSSRYKYIPEVEAQRYRALRCSLQVMMGMGQASDCPENEFQSNRNQDKNSITGLTTRLMTELNTYTSNLGQADANRDALNIAQGQYSMRSFAKRNSRMKRL